MKLLNASNVSLSPIEISSNIKNENLLFSEITGKNFFLKNYHLLLFHLIQVNP